MSFKTVFSEEAIYLSPKLGELSLNNQLESQSTGDNSFRVTQDRIFIGNRAYVFEVKPVSKLVKMLHIPKLEKDYR